ncbi:hypothetical protein ARMGADRAFT_1035522 [Armillaria gallica]|uniref:Uncharacterized protein n=1 Tax=Armillaria gallica TaxID=47427 RepID=A0A2H3CXW7_ARMGA|nr:hypothetical protein ARMGADRAFT_1035522 [Armillaria gallica]
MDIYRGPQLGILPQSIEYMTTFSQKLEPHVAVSVLLMVIPLLNNIKQDFLINGNVAEALVSCPGVPLEWQTYLEQFSTLDKDNNSEECAQALVLVAPKLL